MPNVNDAFPSNYLKAADLNGKSYRMTIRDVVSEELGSETKLVMYFEKTEKGLVLNKTNAYAVSQLHGPETETWHGKIVEVRPDSTMFQGRPTPCIRIRPIAPAAAGPIGAKPKPVVDPADYSDEPGANDVPF